LQEELIIQHIHRELDYCFAQDELPPSFSIALKQQSQEILQDIQSIHNLRHNEVMQIQSDLINELKKDVDSKLQYLSKTLHETQERSIKVKHGLKEFSSNIVKALANKIDRQDVPNLIEQSGIPSKDQARYSQHYEEESSAFQSPIGTKTSQLRQEIAHHSVSKVSRTKSPLKPALSKQYTMIDPTELQYLKTQQKKSQQELQSMQRLVRDIQSQVRTMLTAQEEHQQRNIESSTMINSSIAAETTTKVSNSVEDWRLALGDVSLNLKRELAEKVVDFATNLWSSVLKQFYSFRRPRRISQSWSRRSSLNSKINSR
jgi:hypothetical protein